jgi:hypothetical protein
MKHSTWQCVLRIWKYRNKANSETARKVLASTRDSPAGTKKLNKVRPSLTILRRLELLVE